MKRSVILALLAALLCAAFLTSCGSGIPAPETAETAVPVSSVSSVSSRPVETEPAEDLPDPAEDGVLRVLLIGNSFCLNWPDELHGMLNAAGIENSVSNVYYPGCTVEQHWEWYMTKQKNYSFYTHENDKRTIVKDVGLKTCLDARNWDVISLQQHFNLDRSADFETGLKSCDSYTRRMVEILKTECPKAKLCWHETWAYQVGWRPEGSAEGETSKYKFDTPQAQTHQYEVIRAVSEKLFETYDFDLYTPAGDAWQIARAAVGDNLCQKVAKNDYYHDGDIGGGQYLNACVWFETLTGQNCVGNGFRPSYELSESMIAALQNAAHTAVEAKKAV